MGEDKSKFKCEEFSRSLSDQARQVVPADIASNDREFIVSIIYAFCKKAGDALLADINTKLDSDEVSIVVQFIGEWIFHKSVDLIRSKLPVDLRTGVLQKVAFTVFEIAKNAIENKMPQEQLINLVEVQVTKSFKAAIEELTKSGKISSENANNALSQSNIDAMAVEQHKQEIKEEKAKIASMSDSKIIKLASFALLIKNFPPEKIKSILQKFDKPEREILIKYMKLEDLEDKFDSRITMKCFEEIKNTLPEAVVVSYNKAYKKLYKIVKNSSKESIFNIIENERPIVKDFVLSCYTKQRVKVPPYIADAISKFIEENAL